MSASFSLGQRVQVPAGTGVVRFVGQTGFAAGKWVGVELDEQGGKNDGSIEGKRYFTTDPGRGVFVRPGTITILDEAGDDVRDIIVRSFHPPRPIPQHATSIKTNARAGADLSLEAVADTIHLLTTTICQASFPSTLLLHLPSSLTSVTEPRRANTHHLVLLPARVWLDPTFRPLLRRINHSRHPIALPSENSSSEARHHPSWNSIEARNAENVHRVSLVLRGCSTNVRHRAPAITKESSFASKFHDSKLCATSTTTRKLDVPSVGADDESPGVDGVERFEYREGGHLPAYWDVSRYGEDWEWEQCWEGLERTLSSESLLEEEPMAPWAVGGEDEAEEEVEEVAPVEERVVDEERPPTRQEVLSPAAPTKDPFDLRAPEAKARAVIAEATVSKREHDELLAKLRILEARRAEDREKLREVDRVKDEMGDWEKVKEKTKAKITELSAELRELRKENKELSAARDSFETKFADLNDQVEISLLDKEVAEEQLETAEANVAEFKERIAELEVEVGVLREENAKLEGEGDAAIASGEERSSLAFIQLEKQNGRLKDALVRLRDLTSETEHEHKQRIADLEKELDLTADLQAEFENNLVELDRAEVQIEDLKIQLDDALGAEDMLEQLTERNLTLSEKNEELEAAVEDLEALQELSNELEENHVETEKQMQEEIDLKDLQLREQSHRVETLEENVADYEGTITQFRELVLSLQSDLENLREHQATRETESQSLTSQSQAMLNLNLKLQSSVLKGQVKTIDLELRKLEAQQALEHLAITKPYLLPAFFDEDQAAVESLLFFERLAYKADLISMVIEQNHNITESLNTVVPETLVAICETRAKLGRYSALNKRFAAQLKRCPAESFLKMGRVYHEVSGTERRIDAFIEALRREELKEVECGKEVDGLIAQAEHLADLHLQEQPLLDLAEREHSYIGALDLDFDTIAAAAGFTKQALATISRDQEVPVELNDVDLDESLFTPLQTLVNQARSSKVVTKKLLRRLDDLVATSAALSMEHAHGFETLAYNSSAIASAAAKLATDIAAYCSELRTSKQPFQPSAVLAIAQEVVATELGKQTGRPLEEIGGLLGQLAQDITTTLGTASDGDHVVKLAYEAPWVLRVAELQSTAAVNVDAERKVVKLNEEMRDVLREMRVKDQAFQESAVKIELMEKRMEAVKKQTDAMGELEGELVKSKKQEKTYEAAIEALQENLDTLEQENVKLKQNAPAADKPGASSVAAGDGEPVSYEGNMETSRLVEQIDSLRGAVRFLRSENSYLKSQDLLAELEHLPSYSLPPSAPTAPAGVPSPPGRTLPHDPVALRQSFATESKLLLREARLLSSTPRVVDLSLARPSGTVAGWQPSARAPENQYLAEKERVRSLGRKVEKLWQMRPMSLSAY
ncbi:dynactin [Pseudohyphozyma bogoriensis]|nr:dynactin [Pseudohyphozyma bogoriensis]